MSEAPPNSREFHEDKLVVRLEEVIPADVQAISPLVRRVMDVVRGFGCAAGEEHTIELSLQEALANAIVHGAREDASKSVSVCVACEPDSGILIVVRDPGPGFEPKSIVSPVIGENVFESHGRGIFLINQLMDHVEYARGGTELRMRKRGGALPPPEAGDAR